MEKIKEEHLMLQKMVREFAQNELAPIAQEIDSQSKFPSDSIEKLSELIETLLFKLPVSKRNRVDDVA